MREKRQTIGTLKETRCHSDTIEVPLMESVFKEFDLVSLMYPAFWFSMLESKMAMLILLEGNIEDHYLRRSDHIFQGLTHDFHTGFHNLQYRGTH